MTLDEFLAAVGNLPLQPTKVPFTFVCTKDGTFHNVPDTTRFTPEQRARTFELIRMNVGGF